MLLLDNFINTNFSFSEEKPMLKKCSVRNNQVFVQAFQPTVLLLCQSRPTDYKVTQIEL